MHVVAMLFCADKLLVNRFFRLFRDGLRRSTLWTYGDGKETDCSSDSPIAQFLP